jgi:hypothetical protein
MADHDLTDEELAREMAAIDQWSEERLDAVRQLGAELADIAISSGGQEQVSRLVAAGRPIRDWVIYMARQEAERNAERKRTAAGRTRTSPVAPCEAYDPRAFWKAFERFKAAIAGLKALPGSAGARARAAALVAFRGGPLPADLPDWDRDFVKLADAALAEVRTALSVPAAWGDTPGGKKCLKADLLNLEIEVDRFEEGVPGEAPDERPE